MRGSSRATPPTKKPPAAADSHSPKPSTSFTPLTSRHSTRLRGPPTRLNDFDLSQDSPPSRRRGRPKAQDWFTPSSKPLSPPPPPVPRVRQPLPSRPTAPIPAVHSIPHPPHIAPLAQGNGVTPPVQTQDVAAPLSPLALTPVHQVPHLPDQVPDLDVDAEEEFWADNIVQGGLPQPHPGDSPQQQQSQQLVQQDQTALPSFLEATEAYIPTHRYPPKSIRPEFSRCLADVWQKLADNPGDPNAWLLLYVFPRVILPATPGPIRDATSKVDAIRGRLQRWRQGDFSALWQEAVQVSKNRPRKRRRRGAPPPSEKTQHEKNVERAQNLGQEGLFTKSLQALVSNGLAEHTQATLEEMKQKHPFSPPPTVPEVDARQMAFSPTQVLEAAKSFHKSTAAGPSGLRIEHLLVVIKSAPPNRSDRALTQLTTEWLT